MIIHFVTTNNHKLLAAQQVIPNLVGLEMELAEIQHHDPFCIVQHKLKEAASCSPEAVIVEDSSLHISCLGGLPGPFIKWFLWSMRPEGIADLVHRYADHRATATVIIGFLEHKNAKPQFFKGEVEGVVVKPRGLHGFGYDSIFCPIGSQKTLGELEGNEYHQMSPRHHAFIKLRDYLQDAYGKV